MATQHYRLSLAIALLWACTIVRTAPPQGRAAAPGHLPPGQAKKVYGTQSAKPFAPGQQKKKH